MHNVPPSLINNPPMGSRSPLTRLCTYQSEYSGIYEPAYQINFVFYDEDEVDNNDDSFDSFTPLLPGGLADR